MQFHQGFRLKHLVAKSGKGVKELATQAGISRTTIYDYYKKEELLRSTVAPVLAALNIDPDVFYGIKNEVGEDVAAYKIDTLAGLRREIELLKQQVAAKDEIIELLKKSKTTNGRQSK